MTDTIQSVVSVNIKEVFRKAMIQYSYEEFALLVAETVKQADEPEKLADCIKVVLQQHILGAFV